MKFAAIRMATPFCAAILALTLAGCGVAAPSPQPPALPVAIDVAAFLFATDPPRNVGPAWVLDVRGLSLVRVTFLPAGTEETHSVYGIRPTCITVEREESWDRPPKKLKAVQDYPAAPCWAPLTILPGQSIRTVTQESPWVWSSAEGGKGNGVFNDWTILSAAPDGQSMTVLEWYQDPDRPEFPDYCRKGLYLKGVGMVKLEDAKC